MVKEKEKKTTSKKVPKEKIIRTKKKTRNTSKEKTKITHSLIPLHEKVSQKEIQELFEYHNITIKELPKILTNDPAIRHLDVKENDVIKITRASATAGETVFYRGVINE